MICIGRTNYVIAFLVMLVYQRGIQQQFAIEHQHCGAMQIIELFRWRSIGSFLGVPEGPFSEISVASQIPLLVDDYLGDYTIPNILG